VPDVDPHQLRGIEINPRAARHSGSRALDWATSMALPYVGGPDAGRARSIHAYHKSSAGRHVLAHDSKAPSTTERTAGYPMGRPNDEAASCHGRRSAESGATSGLSRTSIRESRDGRRQIMSSQPAFHRRVENAGGIGEGYVETLWRRIRTSPKRLIM